MEMDTIIQNKNLNQKGFFPILLGVIAIILILGIYVYYFGTQRNNLNNLTSNVLQTPTNQPIISNSPSANPSPTVTVVTGGKCANEVLRVSITVPQGWICKSVADTYDGWMDIKSDLFTIEISNLGRGPYCGDGPPLINTNDSCRTSTFVSNDNVNLTLFTSYDEDKEISGGIIPLNKQEQYSKSWISIKYTNMEKQKLTNAQKSQLVDLLNTISVIK